MRWISDAYCTKCPFQLKTYFAWVLSASPSVLIVCFFQLSLIDVPFRGYYIYWPCTTTSFTAIFYFFIVWWPGVRVPGCNMFNRWLYLPNGVLCWQLPFAWCVLSAWGRGRKGLAFYGCYWYQYEHRCGRTLPACVTAPSCPALVHFDWEININ